MSDKMKLVMHSFNLASIKFDYGLSKIEKKKIIIILSQHSSIFVVGKHSEKARGGFSTLLPIKIHICNLGT